MVQTTTVAPLIINTAAHRDPTRTVTLRAKYAAQMRHRWGRVLRLAQASLETRQFPARAAFGRWFEITLQEQVIEDKGTWQKEYLRAGYGRGVKQADLDIKAAKIQLPVEGLARRQLLQGTYTRAIDAAVTKYSADLQTIADEVMTQIDAQGFGAWDLADPAAFLAVVENRVRKVGISRGTVLAVTSVVDAFNVGILDRFEGLGFRSVGIIPEVIFTTAGDAGVCRQCQGLSGRAWTIFEARGILPVHARCRCRWKLDLGSLAGLGWLLSRG